VTWVIWTRESVERVEAIKAYVARDSVRYAALLAERIVAAVGWLESFPESRLGVPEVGAEFLREISMGPIGSCIAFRPSRFRWSRSTMRRGCWARSQRTEPRGQWPNNALNAAVLASCAALGPGSTERRAR